MQCVYSIGESEMRANMQPQIVLGKKKKRKKKEEYLYTPASLGTELQHPCPCLVI